MASPSSPLSAEAPAKINRELRVGRRRPDGYHEIRSRIVSIGLADRITVEPAGSLTLSCEGIPVAHGDSNLVLRAARALADRAGVPAAARIRLEKRIPVGSGLGGASADAAVTLLLLADLWRAPLRREEILEVAERVGSDVPFFLTGGEAEVSGRGERVAAREDESVAELLLLVPPFPLSTAEVYAAHDALRAAGTDLPERLEVENSGLFFGPNDLASAVLVLKPEMSAYLRSAREATREFGITGSGSTVVLRGTTWESERWLAGRHPEITIIRARTLRREEYRRRIWNPGGTTWKSPR